VDEVDAGVAAAEPVGPERAEGHRERALRHRLGAAVLAHRHLRQPLARAWRDRRHESRVVERADLGEPA
jgi:hypothetical protein